MKKYKIAFYIIAFIFTFQAMAKSNNPITEDKLLKKLEQALPKGWILLIKENDLIIERQDSILLLHQNMINADFRSWEELENKIKKEGKKTTLQLIYNLEPKWSDEKIKQNKKEQEDIWQSRGNLLKKYKLEHLVSKNAKGDVFFFKDKASNEEKKKIEAFYEEKRELDSKAYQLNEQLPKYNTEHYSLVKEKEPDSQFEHIFPREVERETFKVSEKIKEVLIFIK